MQTETTLPAQMRRRYLPLFGSALLLFALITGGFYALRDALDGNALDGSEESEFVQEEPFPANFQKWQKPQIALIFSGQMHGYTDPCGCSYPQYGGLERRYNFIDSLKKKDWNPIGIDMGELPGLKGIREQNALKYVMSIRSLGAMNYRVAGLGRDEFHFSLTELLTPAWDEKKPFPRHLALPLAQTAPKEKYHDLNVRPYEIIKTTGPTIGVINMIGPDLRDELAPMNEKFLSSVDEIRSALKAFAEAGVEIGIVLSHEYPALDPMAFPKGSQKRLVAAEKRRMEQALKCAEFCAEERKKNKKIPEIQLMMVLTDEDESEPRSIMRQLDPKLPTQVIETGHKGKYVGLVGVYRQGKSFRLQYEMVRIGPEMDTPEKDKAKHPVIALMQNHNDELKAADMLAKYPRNPHINQLMPEGKPGLKATYVGSERCGDCHETAYKQWRNSEHSHATETLEKLTFPSGQNFDPECMKCHTTGFQHPGGYNDFVPILANWPAKPNPAPNAKRVKEHNLNTRGVGCESCHGPASEHVKNTKNKEIHKLINPYAPTARERTLEAVAKPNAKQKDELKQLFNTRMRAMGGNLCMKCHDSENDVNWGKEGHDVADKWLKLIHRTPNGNGGGGNPPVAKDEPPPLVIEVAPDTKK